jgi:5-(carboxyamino)imidazole ribonucleotide synthase
VRVGVIGGGQLARMMIPAAIELGVELRVLAGGRRHVRGARRGPRRRLHRRRDGAGLRREVDVVTFDHEHVPQDVLHALVDAGIPVRPGPDALRFAQDKLLMRERLSELGLPVPDWARRRDDRPTSTTSSPTTAARPS